MSRGARKWENSSTCFQGDERKEEQEDAEREKARRRKEAAAAVVSGIQSSFDKIQRERLEKSSVCAICGYMNMIDAADGVRCMRLHPRNNPQICPKTAAKLSKLDGQKYSNTHAEPTTAASRRGCS